MILPQYFAKVSSYVERTVTGIGVTMNRPVRSSTCTSEHTDTSHHNLYTHAKVGIERDGWSNHNSRRH